MASRAIRDAPRRVTPGGNADAPAPNLRMTLKTICRFAGSTGSSTATRGLVQHQRFDQRQKPQQVVDLAFLGQRQREPLRPHPELLAPRSASPHTRKAQFSTSSSNRCCCPGAIPPVEENLNGALPDRA